MDDIPNKEAILEKYQEGKPLVPQNLELTDGRELLGQEVSEGNRLLYVIKDGSLITVEYAEGQHTIFIGRLKPNLVKNNV